MIDKALLISLREQGLTYKEISDRTGISKSSISYYLHNYTPSDVAQDILLVKTKEISKNKSKKSF